MLDPARPVPPYDRENIASAWWYCLYCKETSAGRFSMENHVKIHHLGGEVEGAEGEDFTNGTHLRVLMTRWEEWGEHVAARFVLSLDSLRGADDFDLEVGDGFQDA